MVTHVWTLVYLGVLWLQAQNWMFRLWLLTQKRKFSGKVSGVVKINGQPGEAEFLWAGGQVAPGTSRQERQE